jgi:hypothetical protein
MLPSIAIVDSVEMIRDGGSLGAAFRGTDGSKYSLFFQLRSQTLPSGNMERLGYEVPAVVDRLAQRSSPVTWEHASILLDQIARLSERERDLHWIGVMREVIDSEGQLPSSIERVLHDVRL